jgi:hypothetical protein
MGWYPCCCVTSSGIGSLSCVICLPDTSPAQYKVDIDNMHDLASFICDDCEMLNGTYIVNQTVGGCWYVLNFPPICGYNRMELLVAAWGYYVSFSHLGTGPGPGPLTFHRLGFTAPRDCRTDGLSLLPQGFTSVCTHIAATCLITAL